MPRKKLTTSVQKQDATPPVVEEDANMTEPLEDSKESDEEMSDPAVDEDVQDMIEPIEASVEESSAPWSGRPVKRARSDGLGPEDDEDDDSVVPECKIDLNKESIQNVIKPFRNLIKPRMTVDKDTVMLPSNFDAVCPKAWSLFSSICTADGRTVVKSAFEIDKEKLSHQDWWLDTSKGPSNGTESCRKSLETLKELFNDIVCPQSIPETSGAQSPVKQWVANLYLVERQRKFFPNTDPLSALKASRYSSQTSKQMSDFCKSLYADDHDFGVCLFRALTAIASALCTHKDWQLAINSYECSESRLIARCFQKVTKTELSASGKKAKKSKKWNSIKDNPEHWIQKKSVVRPQVHTRSVIPTEKVLVSGMNRRLNDTKWYKFHKVRDLEARMINARSSVEAIQMEVTSINRSLEARSKIRHNWLVSTKPDQVGADGKPRKFTDSEWAEADAATSQECKDQFILVLDSCPVLQTLIAEARGGIQTAELV